MSYSRKTGLRKFIVALDVEGLLGPTLVNELSGFIRAVFVVTFYVFPALLSTAVGTCEHDSTGNG